ncbi:Protein N-acetyltransferase, RimJ/RimL family [Variovorax sp. HW608]|uniref:GNAT family N-acetyltransferase n=1 Tax=Variovorax sp. HW608 TaxID=1034889 RepID=UPI0008200B2D|nr:GNAT family N-acetyltransferase [Variovorax sp. HW608]SCK45858.1 Protein N-acetyltransferase, RimJ/RimL family [Variovorax sp. HW608]
MTQCIEFDTERLRLRQWRDSDREAFAALNADPRVMEFFAAPLTRAESDALVDRIAAGIDERGWGLWAVQERESGAFVGFVGLSVPRPDLPCSPCVEVGWRLARAHWGKGYAQEAARGALHVGFERLGLPELVSFTAVPNLRSEAVMQRLRMTADGVFEHPALPEGHPLRPHKLYRLGRASWSTSSRSCGNTFDTFASR